MKKETAHTIDFTRRDEGIDLLRALTMFVMIFVNNLWMVKGAPRWMGHAGFFEDFMGMADVVFPSFLFAVGMSIPFAIENRYRKGHSVEATLGHILQRTFALLIMGAMLVNSESGLSPEMPFNVDVYAVSMVIAFVLIWNVYPRAESKNRKVLYFVLKLIGWGILLFLAISFRDTKGGFFSARWWGILGIIGWTYLVAALIYLFSRDRIKYLIPAWLAFVFLAVLTSRFKMDLGGKAILSLPQPNFFSQMLDVVNIGNGSSLSFTMGGVLFTILVLKLRNLPRGRKLTYVLAAVTLFTLLGYFSNRLWMVSKNFGTPPWIFYVLAITILLYALLSGLASAGKGHWMNIIKPAGTATLTCYTIPYLMQGVMGLLGVNIPEWLMSGIWGIVYCLVFAFVAIGITALLGRAGIKLKI